MNRSASVEKYRAAVHVGPRGTLELLSQREVEVLTSSARETQLLELFRRCALAVLNTGNEIDDSAALFEEYRDFSIEVGRRTRGLKLIIRNAPASAFVDGRIVEGIRQHLFAVLRDIVYMGTDVAESDLSDSAGVTDAVFQILKHARILNPDLAAQPGGLLGWPFHQSPRVRLHQRGGIPARSAGARHLHRLRSRRHEGPHEGRGCGPRQAAPAQRPLSGIVGAGHHCRGAAESHGESPGGDAGHREAPGGLSALAHGIVVFPGGVGTAEEILYLLGVLLDPPMRVRSCP
jgi:pyrimidine/purine-5'-nucleotide nucleosidase